MNFLATQYEGASELRFHHGAPLLPLILPGMAEFSQENLSSSFPFKREWCQRNHGAFQGLFGVHSKPQVSHGWSVAQGFRPVSGSEPWSASPQTVGWVEEIMAFTCRNQQPSSCGLLLWDVRSLSCYFRWENQSELGGALGGREAGQVLILGALCGCCRH